MLAAGNAVRNKRSGSAVYGVRRGRAPLWIPRSRLAASASIQSEALTCRTPNPARCLPAQGKRSPGRTLAAANQPALASMTQTVRPRRLVHEVAHGPMSWNIDDRAAIVQKGSAQGDRRLPHRESEVSRATEVNSIPWLQDKASWPDRPTSCSLSSSATSEASTAADGATIVGPVA
jgi:hypothetical protein